MYATLVLEKETGKSKLLDPLNEEIKFTEGLDIKIDHGNPFRATYVTGDRAAKVVPLPPDIKLSSKRINSMNIGAPEKFRSKIELTDEMTNLTVALWLEFLQGGLRRFEFLVGGNDLNIEFPISMLAGHDGLGFPPDTMIRASQKPTGISFKQTSHISGWMKIEERFADSLVCDDPNLDWKLGNPIYTRWAIKADLEDNSMPAIVLEGAPIVGKDFDEMPQESRNILCGGTTKSFVLWSVKAEWHAPSGRSQLCTTPGLNLRDQKNSPQINDMHIRWAIEHAKDTSRRGSYTTGDDWLEYLAKPTKIVSPEALPVGLVLEKEDNNNETEGEFFLS